MTDYWREARERLSRLPFPQVQSLGTFWKDHVMSKKSKPDDDDDDAEEVVQPTAPPPPPPSTQGAAPPEPANMLDDPAHPLHHLRGVH